MRNFRLTLTVVMAVTRCIFSVVLAAALHVWADDHERREGLFASVNPERETTSPYALGRPELLSESSMRLGAHREPPRVALVRVDIAQLEAARKLVEQQRDAKLNLNLSTDNLIEVAFDTCNSNARRLHAVRNRPAVPGIPH